MYKQHTFEEVYMSNTKTQDIMQLSAPYANECQGTARRVLFVCSAGMLRSATAASVAIKLGMNARACGSENYALIPLSVNLVNWAESIFFVNPYNFVSAKHTFFEDYDTKSQIEDKGNVWNIEDIYNYNDPALVKIITELLA